GRGRAAGGRGAGRHRPHPRRRAAQGDRARQRGCRRRRRRTSHRHRRGGRELPLRSRSRHAPRRPPLLRDRPRDAAPVPRPAPRSRGEEDVLDENAAGALSYAGGPVALGVIIAHAADGAFAGGGASLKAYAISLAGSVALSPVRQLVVGVLLVGDRPRLRGGLLDEGIARGRNVGLGVLEAGAYVAVAVLLARLT